MTSVVVGCQIRCAVNLCRSSKVASCRICHEHNNFSMGAAEQSAHMLLLHNVLCFRHQDHIRASTTHIGLLGATTRDAMLAKASAQGMALSLTLEHNFPWVLSLAEESSLPMDTTIPPHNCMLAKTWCPAWGPLLAQSLLLANAPDHIDC